MGQVAYNDIVEVRKELNLIFNKEFEDYTGLDAAVAPFVTRVTTTKNYVAFGWMSDNPEPYKFKGARELKGLHSYDYEIKVDDWALDIQVQKNTIEDDPENMVVDRVKGAISKARITDITETINLLKNGETIEAFDGIPFFSTQHVFKEYKTPQSNLLTGNGVATSGDIITDIYRGIVAMGSVKGDRGTFLFNPNVQRKILLAAPIGMMKVMNEALMADIIGNTTNVIAKSFSFEVLYLQNLDDANDWYMLDIGAELKPIIKVDREAPHFIAMDKPTDYNVYWNKMYIYSVDFRCGYGFGQWFRAVKIKNS